jgi:hypothetical protein
VPLITMEWHIHFLSMELYYAKMFIFVFGWQGFAEKLFSRLQKCNERFEVILIFCTRITLLMPSLTFSLARIKHLSFEKSFSLQVRMMMLKVIARTIGLHHLVLLNFYPYLQRYVQVCYLRWYFCLCRPLKHQLVW